jgi:hypothetical protein
MCWPCFGSSGSLALGSYRVKSKSISGELDLQSLKRANRKSLFINHRISNSVSDPQDARSTLDEAIVEIVIVLKLLPPKHPVLSLGDTLCFGPSSSHFTQPDYQAIHSVASFVAIYFTCFHKRHLPYTGDPGKIIQFISLVEMGSCRGNAFPSPGKKI